MDCKKIQRVIFRFIYGESDGLELMSIKAHLDRCSECRRESEIIDGILMQIRGAVNIDAPPAGICDRMRERVRKDFPQHSDAPKGDPEPASE